jgi:flagellar hook-length control protein FliK
MSLAFSPFPAGRPVGNLPLTTGASGKAEATAVPQQSPAAVEAFALLLAGLAGEAPAASGIDGLSDARPVAAAMPLPEALADAAPAPTASGLPWDMLSAAAEEAGRFAVAFQWPLPQQAQAAASLAPQPAELTGGDGPPATGALRPAAMTLAATVALPDPPQAMPDSSAPVEAAPPAAPSPALPTSSAPAAIPPQPPALSPGVTPPAPAGRAQPGGLPVMPETVQQSGAETPLSASLPAAASSLSGAVPGFIQAALPAAEPTQTNLPPPINETPPFPQASEATPRRLQPGTPSGRSMALAGSAILSTPSSAAMPRSVLPQETTAALPEPIEAEAADLPGLSLPAPQDGAAASSVVDKPSIPAAAFPSAAPAEHDSPINAPAQPVGVPHAPPSSSPVTAANPPPLQRAHIAAEAVPQVVMRAAQAQQDGVARISVDLRPPELGRVELQLTFRDGTVQVVMRAEQPDTFEALRQDRHHLEQQMAEAGLQLAAGGLDLQQGRLPRPEPEPVPRSPSAQAASDSDAAVEEAGDGPHPRAIDSLIDIIA